MLYFTIKIISKAKIGAVLHPSRNEEISNYEDYTSHNTRRLNVEQIKRSLLELDYIKEELKC